MGFYYKHAILPGHQLGLAAFRDDFTAFLRYMSFLKGRGTGGDYMSKHCYSASRVLHYLKAAAPAPYSSQHLQRHKEQLAILSNLSWQLRKICLHKPFNYQALMDTAGWKDAPELIAFIEEEKMKACTILKVSSSSSSKAQHQHAGGLPGAPQRAAACASCRARAHCICRVPWAACVCCQVWMSILSWMH